MDLNMPKKISKDSPLENVKISKLAKLVALIRAFNNLKKNT